MAQGNSHYPTRPTARSTGQSSSKVLSMTRAQQTTEAYPDLGVLKKELEKTQKERNKANLDRDQAKLDREKGSAGKGPGGQRARSDSEVAWDAKGWTSAGAKGAGECRELWTTEVGVGENRTTTTRTWRTEGSQAEGASGYQLETRVTHGGGWSPQSKSTVQPWPRGREHMSEGLRSLETQPVRPLMDVVLPGYTPTSTSSDSQVSGGSSRLKELGEKLRQKSRESSARPELPPTWREKPVRSVVISSYKKNTEGGTTGTIGWIGVRNRKPGGTAFMMQPGWSILRHPRVPEGAVHLIIGDSLVRVLTGSVALADRNLEFRWSGHATDVGDAWDARDD